MLPHPLSDVIPNPFDTLEQFQRFHHCDISGMSTYDRWREARRVELRLALDDRPDPWLTERLAALQGGAHA